PVGPFDEGAPMPIFILLSTLTQQGVQTLKSNPERLRQVNHDVEELGCRVLHQWATLGEFDFVNVVDAPDLETVAKVSVALSARGSTRIETLPALERDGYLAREPCVADDEVAVRTQRAAAARAVQPVEHERRQRLAPHAGRVR